MGLTAGATVNTSAPTVGLFKLRNVAPRNDVADHHHNSFLSVDFDRCLRITKTTFDTTVRPPSRIPPSSCQSKYSSFMIFPDARLARVLPKWRLCSPIPKHVRHQNALCILCIIARPIWRPRDNDAMAFANLAVFAYLGTYAWITADININSFILEEAQKGFREILEHKVQETWG